MAKLDAQDLYRQALAEKNKYKNTSKERFHKGVRIPFLVGRESQSPEDYLKFWINPSQCGWKVGLRSTIEKVAGGAIHHEWPTVGLGIQEADALLDHPVVSFSFQSGAISPGAHEELSNVPVAKNIPEGLGNFYDFMEILSKSNLRPSGQPDYVNILYTSNIFPSIWLQGFFTEEGVNWDDSADNPNQINGWGASFMVFKSSPELSNRAALESTFSAMGFRAFTG